MENITVKELMVPLNEYATVNKNATLEDVILALGKAQREYDQSRFRHRAVLILDDEGKVIGKASKLDILRALEQKYNQIGAVDVSRFGLNKQFIRTMFDQFHLWKTSLVGLRKVVKNVIARDIMQKPKGDEYVNADDGLNLAIHQLVMGQHQSLLVVENDSIVGILRLTDVFCHIANYLCEEQSDACL